jgi:hypothetical protein
VLLEELHASKRESGGARTVKWRGNTALEGVAERGGSSVEQVLALLLEDLGERLGVVDGRRLFGSETVRQRLTCRTATGIDYRCGWGVIQGGKAWCGVVRSRTHLMTSRPSDLPLTSSS